jgi:ABC-type phosphate transport system substrate-binding protein
MGILRITLHGVIIAIGLALVVGWPTATRAARDPLVVLVGADSPVHDLGASQLRALFLGRVVTVSGTRLIPFNQPAGSSEREHFDRALLGMSPLEAARYWVNERIRGNAAAPRQVSSSRLVVRVVERLPGAVGYVPLSESAGSVRALTIDGVAPTSSSYPL